MISTALLLALPVSIVDPAPFVPSPTQAEDTIVAPPGLVLIEGGRTKIGVDPKDIVPIIESSRITKLVGETPEHQVKLDDFLLMATEVTNEQYLAFVEATGAKPPRSWGEDAINAEIARFAEREAERIRELKEAGLPFERQKFDAAAQMRWWDESWQDQEHAIPDGKEDHPVVFVTFEETEGYARWAGVRLMTEQEFQRAGRGDTDRTYPWGDDFDSSMCHTAERKVDATEAVGSFPDGATEDGIHDLSGNVWEWTSSPYMAFEDYEPIVVELLGRKESAMADWDPNQRVVVSGSYKLNWTAARITVRRATERFQATDAMGFRCAASTRPGIDLARRVVDEDISVYVIPEGTTYDPNLTVAMDRWESRAGSSAVSNYRVVTGYHNLIFVPVSKLDAAGLKPLAETSINDAPVHVGVLSTSFRLAFDEKELDDETKGLAPGTYLVAWRGKGEKKETREDEEAEPDPIEAAIAELVDEKYDHYVFYDLEGTPVAATRAANIDHERLKPGKVELETRQPSEEQKQYGVLPWDQIDLDIAIPGKTSSRGFALEMTFMAAEDSVTAHAWRANQG